MTKSRSEYIRVPTFWLTKTIRSQHCACDFSFVSIKSEAHRLWMESMSDCGSVLSVAQLIEWTVLIVSADRKYFECLIELQIQYFTECIYIYIYIFTHTYTYIYIYHYIPNFPKDRSFGKTREHCRGWWINTVCSDKWITTSYVTKQPTDITTRQTVGTELI